MSIFDIITNIEIDESDSISSIIKSFSDSATPSDSSTSSTSKIDDNKVKRYIKEFDSFYAKVNDKMIFKIIDIVQRKSKVSLRLIEWFVSKYAQKHIIEIYDSYGMPLNIYNSYHIKTKVCEKKYFDLFRRVNIFTYKFKGRDDMTIETTVSQLNFFKWLLENNIYEYIEENSGKLSKLMSIDNALENDNRKRKMLNKS